jgi:hypothetical protein
MDLGKILLDGGVSLRRYIYTSRRNLDGKLRFKRKLLRFPQDFGAKTTDVLYQFYV